jgi:predicted dehydrogenase
MPKPNFRDGVKNHVVLDAVERSARTGRWQKIKV